MNNLDDTYVQGQFGCARFAPPAGCIGNSAIAVMANIDAAKVVHQRAACYNVGPGAPILAMTSDVHIVYGTSGVVLGFEAAITGALATGADRHVTVDLQRSTAGGAFASVLSAPIDFTSASTLRVPAAATIALPALVSGDLLRVVVTVSGSAGAQAMGLVAVATYTELPF